MTYSMVLEFFDFPKISAQRQLPFLLLLLPAIFWIIIQKWKQRLPCLHVNTSVNAKNARISCPQICYALGREIEL